MPVNAINFTGFCQCQMNNAQKILMIKFNSGYL